MPGQGKIFISYGRKDAAAFVDKLESDLRQAGFVVFRDITDLQAPHPVGHATRSGRVWQRHGFMQFLHRTPSEPDAKVIQFVSTNCTRHGLPIHQSRSFRSCSYLAAHIDHLSVAVCRF